MELVRQLTKNGCGQACVAMVCGVDFWAAVSAMNTKGKTTHAHIRTGLRAFGKYWGPVRPLVRGAPILCLAIVEVPGHWVVHEAGVIWDPAGHKYLVSDYPVRPVSYMPVLERDESGGQAIPGRPLGRRPPADGAVGSGDQG